MVNTLKRTVFFVSDGTGLTAEALGQAKERPTVEQAAALHGVIQGLLDRLALTPEQQRAVPDALTAALQQEGLL